MSDLPLIGLLHLLMGTLAVISGAGALAAAKGRRLHRMAGNLFFGAMLLLIASGLYFSVTRSILFTFFLSVMAFYLLSSGWATVMRREGKTERFELANCLFILIAGASALGLGLTETIRGAPLQSDVSSAAFFILAALAVLFGAQDVAVIRRGGCTGKHRIARHLWRMCLSLFIAVTIFFLGNNDVLPEVLRTPFFLTSPIVAVLALMVFWLMRVTFTNWYRTPSR
ncbi:hypothetical protein [Hyphomonas sp. BRH_c22]|uniref:hypothetical protein n=1 Tax=Hyphomonas sp. BRH_c22 TaxID=1629710 RepID=UPI000AC40344|nr:hypothetical protein [Hyphomonas sp. BRH_c22]